VFLKSKIFRKEPLNPLVTIDIFRRFDYIFLSFKSNPLTNIVMKKFKAVLPPLINQTNSCWYFCRSRASTVLFFNPRECIACNGFLLNSAIELQALPRIPDRRILARSLWTFTEPLYANDVSGESKYCYLGHWPQWGKAKESSQDHAHALPLFVLAGCLDGWQDENADENGP